MKDIYQTSPINELEKKLGYKFNDITLLENAMVHSSFVNEAKHHDGKLSDNERLEFLGDSVLSIVITDYLYNNCPKKKEGVLTRVRASVVCENTLAEKATQICLGDYLRLGHGEIAGDGRNRKSILADAFEATLGALYLDGGLEVVKGFLLPLLEEDIKTNLKSGSEDYKSMLQRFIQQSPDDVLEYCMVSEEGPPHNRRFTFNAILNNNVIGTGTDTSKRRAEQLAAKEALELFGELKEQ